LYGQAIYFNNYNYILAEIAGTQGSAYANTYISYPTFDSGIVTANNFSISCWVNPQYAGSLVSPAPNQVILKIVDGQGGFWFQTNPGVSTNGPFFTRGTNVTCPTLQAYNKGSWCHLAVSLSNIGQSVGQTQSSFYFNGIFQSSGTHTAAYTSSQLYIGAQNGGNAFHGYVQDLRIYNTALTTTQIQGIYQSQGIPPRASLP